MSQLWQSEAEFESLGIEVKVVTFDSPSMGKRYAQQRDARWPMLHDQDRKLYHAYGFGRASLAKLMGPVAVLKYIPQILTGHSGTPGKDIFQMGGNVLIDPDGIVKMHHVSDQPHDRPTANKILDFIGRQNNPI